MGFKVLIVAFLKFASLGGFILMFGFLAFNGGSTSEISSPGIGQTVAKAMVCIDSIVVN